MRPVPGAVVVGASAAGLAAADGLREGGWTHSITVLEEQRTEPYDRPMLSKGMLTDDSSAPLPLRTTQQVLDRELDIKLGHAARGLDIDRRLVVTSDGDAIPYSSLVLATGSHARPIITSTVERLPTLRNLDDLSKLRALAESGQPVTIVGAGFISLEIAAALSERGVAVCILGAEALPLAEVFGPQVAEWLREMHLSHKVMWRSGSKVIAVEGKRGDYLVRCDDGSTYRSAVVFAGIGDVPNDEWLTGSGVELDEGVVCDPAGRTNVPDVWAVGDVARIRGADGERGIRFGHWTNAIEHGRQVGLNISRSETEPYHLVRSFWTEQYGHTIRSIGSRQPDGIDELTEGDLAAGAFVMIHSRDGVLNGITSSGRDRSLRGYRKLLLAGATVEDAHALAKEQRD